jgi:hypothetical protein
MREWIERELTVRPQRAEVAVALEFMRSAQTQAQEPNLRYE